MRLASCLLLGAALTVGAAPLRADHPDTLYMKNGDRLTGTIKKLNAGALQVSLDYADGTVAIGWNRVQRIGSPNLFIVYMADGEVYSGRLAILPSDETDSVRIQITTGEGERVLIDKRQIAALGSTSDTFWGRFSGNVASGLSYTKGNTNTAFSFSSSVLYVRPRWNAGLTFNSNLSSAEGADRSTRNQAGSRPPTCSATRTGSTPATSTASRARSRRSPCRPPWAAAWAATSATRATSRPRWWPASPGSPPPTPRT